MLMMIIVMMMMSILERSSTIGGLWGREEREGPVYRDLHTNLPKVMMMIMMMTNQLIFPRSSWLSQTSPSRTPSNHSSTKVLSKLIWRVTQSILT